MIDLPKDISVPKTQMFLEVWPSGEISHLASEAIAELLGIIKQKDEALTIAWRLCLQEAWGDLREHLEYETSPAGPDPWLGHDKPAAMGYGGPHFHIDPGDSDD